MKPDTSHWRDHRRYAFFDSLPAEGLAWECLRRDKPYQAYYRQLANAGTCNLPLPSEAERRWGLRFRRATVPVDRGPDRNLVPEGEPRHHSHGVDSIVSCSIADTASR
jgi:hypothetical protein